MPRTEQRQIFLGIKEVHLKRRGTFTVPACPALPALKMWQFPASESDSNHMLGPAYLQGPAELPRPGAMHEKPLGRASLGSRAHTTLPGASSPGLCECLLSTQPAATSASHFLPLGPPNGLSSWHTGTWLTTQLPCQSPRDWEPLRLLTGSLNNPLLIRSGGTCHPQASSFTCGHFLS